MRIRSVLFLGAASALFLFSSMQSSMAQQRGASPERPVTDEFLERSFSMGLLGLIKPSNNPYLNPRPSFKKGFS
jgi:hypothetical protein